ncbi:hypothetical protein [Paraburkholderia sp.]|uniref:hypothetical protein n=1 Tax=Paraburkholderia sp. TaxID=1926495 RepID=UPI00239326AC|nr:hypothetical protein [Paraburkholderia sp.]MDE1181832.1 hypothetical protein [Paraburkholderia sp.]
MNIDNQPTADMIEHVRDIPIYRDSIEKNFFPIIDKHDIARDFPDSWMTPHLAQAIEIGAAEFVLSTGTHHARMQIIRPPYFLLNSYYRLWRAHPDIGFTWREECQRVSLTTVLATEHVARVNAGKHGVQGRESSQADPRRLDARTLYLNQRLDPACWTRSEIAQMLDDIETARDGHPQGFYHLDCASYHLAHFVRKLDEFGLTNDFPKPASIIHAYEYTPDNVKRFLQKRFDCPIVELFGSTELGYLYYGDQQGCYKPYLDKMQVELIPFDSGSGIYSLIVSSIRNPYMPLIRYRSGDCAKTIDGSPDPAKIIRFCGREKEMLEAPSGIVAQSDFDELISNASRQIFVYQLRTSHAQCGELHYTTFDDNPLPLSTAAQLSHDILRRTGLHVGVYHRLHIPIGKSGKYAWLLKMADAPIHT